MDLIIPDSGLFIWMLLVFLIAMFILRKFAWKPILSALKARERSIDDALKASEKAKKEMSELKANNEKIMAEGKAERDQMLNEAREMKDEIISEARQSATNEGKKLIEAARQSIENEKAAAMNDIKKQIAELSVEIAEIIIKEKLKDSDSQNELIEKRLKDVTLN
ncbi:MAG: F0F1 ATP synthase subunit B [Bacteroidetes bacterium]|jgi:F-type H+-transporting ATPase subunit b|nr:F0F1 ATP synthase subunit B [Bacteroidota bacterium]